MTPREALVRIRSECDASLEDVERAHGSRERLLLAVIPSIVDAALADAQPGALRFEPLYPEDDLASILSSHLYDSHGINTRREATVDQIVAVHVADHESRRPDSDRPNGWDEHDPDALYLGKWVRFSVRESED